MPTITICEKCGDAHWSDKDCPTCTQSVDWESIAEAAAGLLVAAKSTGYSSTFDPHEKCVYNAKKLAKALGYKLVK